MFQKLGNERVFGTCWLGCAAYFQGYEQLKSAPIGRFHEPSPGLTFGHGFGGHIQWVIGVGLPP